LLYEILLSAFGFEAITEPATVAAKSYRMWLFHGAMRTTAYSFLDFYSNIWNPIGCFLLKGRLFFVSSGGKPPFLTCSIFRFSISLRLRNDPPNKSSIPCGLRTETPNKFSIPCGLRNETPNKFSISCGLRNETPNKFSIPCGLRNETPNKFSIPCGLRNETPNKFSIPCGLRNETPNKSGRGACPR